jgi:hypothetical protein
MESPGSIPTQAHIAQRKERCPPEAEVAGSNPVVGAQAVGLVTGVAPGLQNLETWGSTPPCGSRCCPLWTSVGTNVGCSAFTHDEGVSGSTPEPTTTGGTVPYKDRAIRLAYQAEWKRQRREKWFLEHGPCIDCSSWEGLELDHVDASTKVSHNVFSWSSQRLGKELEKCVVRCRPCHWAKTVASGELRPVQGERHPNAKLNSEQVREIRRIREVEKIPFAEIALRFGVGRVAISQICSGARWGHLK